MIEINLLPKNLRRKSKKGKFLGNINIPLEVVIGAGGGLFMILIFSHILLLGVGFSKLAIYKSFKNQFQSLQPQKEKADAVIKELRDLQASSKAVHQIAGGETILWSQKLNILSDSLPRGVWLKKVALNENVFFIEGSAIASEDNEMINVHTLTSNLKESNLFFDHLGDLELGSIQRKKIEKVEIADFVLTAQMQ